MLCTLCFWCRFNATYLHCTSNNNINKKRWSTCTHQRRFWKNVQLAPSVLHNFMPQVSFHFKLKNIGKIKVFAKILSGFCCLQSTETPLAKVTNDLLLAANKGLHCAPYNSFWPCSSSAFDRRDPKVYSTIRESMLLSVTCGLINSSVGRTGRSPLSFENSPLFFFFL